jgi:hypothetical protein
VAQDASLRVKTAHPDIGLSSMMTRRLAAMVCAAASRVKSFARKALFWVDLNGKWKGAILNRRNGIAVRYYR